MSEDPKTEPKAAKATIYVDVEDEITSIIDKVDAAPQKVVALVLPKRASVLQSVVNMRLLARGAETAKKSVVLITTEKALLPLAGIAGLHVADSLQSKPYIPDAPNLPKVAEKTPLKEEIAPASEVGDEKLPTKIDYKKSIGELAAVHEVDHPETIELGNEEDDVEAAAKGSEKLPKAPKSIKDKALKVPNFDRFRLSLGLGVAGLVALIVLLVLALKVLPKATITVQTSSTPLSANFTLNTSPTAKSLDETNDIIPAVSKTSDQTGSQQVPATGQQNNGTKATGSVTMTACVSSPGQLSDVPAGTGISTNGLTYITQKNASFSYTGPCNNNTEFEFQSGSVGITAQAGGAKYNTSLSSAEVSGYSGVSADGSASGGTDSIQTVVSQSDVDSAVAKLKSTSGDSFTKTFESQLDQQGFYILTSTLKAGDPSTTASPAVGQQASSTTVSIKITYTVLVVKKADLTKAILDTLNGQIDKTKQKVDQTDLLKNASVTVSNQTSPTTANLNISEDAAAVPIIDSTTLKNQIKGKKSGDIENQISSIPGVKSVNVKFSPFWVSKAPSNTGKITISLQHVNGQ